MANALILGLEGQEVRPITISDTASMRSSVLSDLASFRALPIVLRPSDRRSMTATKAVAAPTVTVGAAPRTLALLDQRVPLDCYSLSLCHSRIRSTPRSTHTLAKGPTGEERRLLEGAISLMKGGFEFALRSMGGP
jgi:hypothetical protein